MTKADLVEEVVRAAGVSKKDAETIVNTVFSSIVEALQQDQKQRELSPQVIEDLKAMGYIE